LAKAPEVFLPDYNSSQMLYNPVPRWNVLCARDSARVDIIFFQLHAWLYLREFMVTLLIITSKVIVTTPVLLMMGWLIVVLGGELSLKHCVLPSCL
jgi:hypothetical protein